MGVGRVDTSRQHSDKGQAQRGAIKNLEIILANRSALLKVKGGEKHLAAALSMSRQDFPFTPNQLSYIDSIYEKTMKGAGHNAFETSHKPNKRNILRYGGGKK